MRLARQFAYVIGVATMGAAAWYLFLYLSRWEWNRALVSGIVFVAVELGMIGLLVVSRLDRLERRAGVVAPNRSVARALRDTAPPANRSFAWLKARQDSFGVFIPVILGAGVILSGLAWVVERVARATGGRVLEADLAGDLKVFSLPEDGLVGPPTGSAATALFHPHEGAR